MKWGNPDLLVWLWLLFPAAWILFMLQRRRLRALEAWMAPEALARMAPAWKRKALTRRMLLWILGAGLLTTALARPQWGFHWEEVKRRGLDIIVVLDTSKSMLTRDIKPDRLTQAQWGIRDMVRRLNGDRVALVPFAGDSYLQCPLTIDYSAFLLTLDDVYAGMIPRGGTAIRHALEKGIASFEEGGNADKVLMLITDGDDHEGNPLELIDRLKEKNIRVYTIGVGTVEGDLVPTDDASAGSQFLKDRSGNAVKSALNERLLSELALSTGGAYIRAAPGDFGLDRLIDQELASLQREQGDARMVRNYEDRAGWFLAAAFLAFVLEASVSNRQRRAA